MMRRLDLDGDRMIALRDFEEALMPIDTVTNSKPQKDVTPDHNLSSPLRKDTTSSKNRLSPLSPLRESYWSESPNKGGTTTPKNAMNRASIYNSP